MKQVSLDDLNLRILERKGGYENLAELLLAEPADLGELCETGSLTINVAGKEFVLVLKVEAGNG